jgi:molecular chaperone GrpE
MKDERDAEAAEAEGAGEELSPQDAAVAMAKELASKEAENKALYDQLLRMKAEFENYRKRVDREKPELVRYGRVQLVETLLPLYDVLLAAHDQVLQAKTSTAELQKGLELIFKEFTKLFQSEGVTPIETVGKPYDFEKHEALGQVETKDYPEGTVVDEIQRGYLLGGKVLRAAKVRVAKAAAKK